MSSAPPISHIVQCDHQATQQEYLKKNIKSVHAKSILEINRNESIIQRKKFKFNKTVIISAITVCALGEIIL